MERHSPLSGDMHLSTIDDLANPSSTFVGWEEVHIGDLRFYSHLAREVYQIRDKFNLTFEEMAFPLSTTSDLLDHD